MYEYCDFHTTKMYYIIGKLTSTSPFIWPVPVSITQSLEIDALQFRFTGWYFIEAFLCFTKFYFNQTGKFMCEETYRARFRNVVIEKVTIQWN